jgi:protein-S-isoprenylcysteine O-methyltransferase Ste14
MNTGANDSAAVRVPPPLPYLAALVVGAGLNKFIWPLPIGLSRGLSVALATLVALLGFALTIGALRLFRATGQDPKPWRATPEIVRTGVYRFTRNPMYVGFTLLQAAIGIGLGNFWVLLLVPLACVVVQITAIRPEEAYLERKFGDAYLDYKKRVRRWL